MTPIIRPVITEKSMFAARQGLYTFLVMPGANKYQVKVAVEKSFKVNVVGMNMLRRHIPAKSTGSKRLTGSPSQTKYAMVHLKKGQSIDLFDLKENK